MKTRKVALCLPNFCWQKADASTQWHMLPYGLCLIAATIRDICHVDIIDANLEKMSQENFHKRIENGAYDLVGISIMGSSEEFVGEEYCLR